MHFYIYKFFNSISSSIYSYIYLLPSDIVFTELLKANRSLIDDKHEFRGQLFEGAGVRDVELLSGADVLNTEILSTGVRCRIIIWC